MMETRVGRGAKRRTAMVLVVMLLAIPALIVALVPPRIGQTQVTPPIPQPLLDGRHASPHLSSPNLPRAPRDHLRAERQDCRRP